jgi:superfamily I DNA/RNA helicase
MDLSTKQKEIINSPYNRIAVRAAAASGKTTLLTEKVRSLLVNGVAPSTIAVITYTRMAAANLIERLGTDYKDGIYIGTVHSLAAHFLSKNGKGGMIHQAAEDEEFDTLFAECQNLNLKGEYNWVLLDEGQDSSTSQLEFIFTMLDPPNIFVVYDDRQCIFEEQNKLDQYIKKEQLYVYQMNENYRNCPSILKFAKAQLSGSKLTDNSVPMNFVPGQVWRDTYTFDLFKTIPPNEYNKWAILAPTNQDLNFLKKQLENLNIPYVTFKQSSITKSQLNKLMSENTVKLLTIHSAKGLEWDNVIVYDVNHFMLKAAWYAAALRYVGATRAKTKLYWLKK